MNRFGPVGSCNLSIVHVSASIQYLVSITGHLSHMVRFWFPKWLASNFYKQKQCLKKTFGVESLRDRVGRMLGKSRR